jgi:3-hydroxypropanoate dehydrogenase
MTDTSAADTEAQSAARALQNEGIKADKNTMRLLLTEARTHYGWQDKAVSDEKLH